MSAKTYSLKSTPNDWFLRKSVAEEIGFSFFFLLVISDQGFEPAYNVHETNWFEKLQGLE